MAIRVGRWDCPVCEHVGNLGPNLTCESCGAPRSADVEFYLTDDAEIVTDKKKIKEALEGPDWSCDHCDSENKASFTHCSACGNIRNQEDTAREESMYDPNAKKREEEEKLKAKERRKEEYLRIQNGNSSNAEGRSWFSKKGNRKIVWWGGGATLILLLLVFLLLPSKVNLTVSGFYWKASVDIQEYKAFIEEDWSVPSGGEEISSFQDIHHYDKVPDGVETKTRTVQVKVGTKQVVCGTINKGNGYFEDKYCDEPVYESREEEYEVQKYRKEPVYKTKYKYRIYKWTHHHTNKSEGNDQQIVYPTESLESGFREKNPKEKIYVFGKNDKAKEVRILLYDKTLWESLSIGQVVEVKHNRLGSYYDLKLPE